MGSIPQQLILQIFLIGLNAFFAMTEIAVISLSSTKLKKMSDEGDRTASRLLKLVEKPSGFLSTIQIGITLAGFLGSAFAADGFSGYLVAWIYDDIGFKPLSLDTLDTFAVIIITLILSYFTLVFGELVPKRIAMQKPMEVAKIACRVVTGLSFIMKPIVWFLSISTNILLKLFRFSTEAEEEIITEEEIRMMVDLGEARGTIDSKEGEWIDNVFEFGERLACDIMTHTTDMVVLSLHSGSEKVLEIIRNSGLSRFPVYEKNIDDIVGILSAREFLLNLSNSGIGQIDISHIMRPPYFVPETISASVLFKDMQSKKIHIAVVIDEYGQTSGIVTMEDLLEEIVGNIYDEFDPAQHPFVEQIDDNLWRVNGCTDLKTLSEVLNMEIPQNPEYDTLGGMVLDCLHFIPADGTVLDVKANGLDIHVETISGKRIKTTLVRKLSPGGTK